MYQLIYNNDNKIDISILLIMTNIMIKLNIMATLIIDKTKSDDGNEYKINENEINDKLILKSIKHYVGVDFPPIPYLWHYDDFFQPFPIHAIKKISIDKLKLLYSINQFNDLTDKNTDVYVVAQYKKEKVMYNELTNPTELYLSYHTWLYNNFTKTTEITNKKLNFKFRFLTGIYPIIGNYEHHKYYPFKNDKKKSAGGMPINADKLEIRQATIHQHENHIKFSGINVCNFNVLSDNSAFFSILKCPHAVVNNNKQFIRTLKGKTNCVVLHIFRNIYDNDPNNGDYTKLVEKFI